jgi:hypothetical protein
LDFNGFGHACLDAWIRKNAKRVAKPRFKYYDKSRATLF